MFFLLLPSCLFCATSHINDVAYTAAIWICKVITSFALSSVRHALRFHFRLIFKNFYPSDIYIIYVRVSILWFSSSGSFSPRLLVSVSFALFWFSLSLYCSFCRRSGCSVFRTIYSQRLSLTRARSSICLNGMACQELISWSTSTRRHQTGVFTTHTRWFCNQSR